MNKYHFSKKLIFFFLFLLLAAAVLFFSYRTYFIAKANRLIKRIKIERKPDYTCEGCKEAFADYPAMHERAYRNGAGIKPQEDNKGLLMLHQKGVLVPVSSCKAYSVRQLHHSVPYILPEGILFLNRLSQRYQQNCLEAGLNYFPFEISSVTRSRQSVEKLKQINPNAIDNSPHLKGKTLDISYEAFSGRPQHRQAFIQALKTLRESGACYVKHELNGCLHITVR